MPSEHVERICRVLLTSCLALAAALPLTAQSHRALLDLGVGSLSPNDPFTATLAFRGSMGWILNHRNAISFDYSRQSGNRSVKEDLGKYARQFVGLAWHTGFRDAFYDDEEHRQQYLLKLSGGLLLRGNTRDGDPVQNLTDAFFSGVALAIRYPLASHIAAVGTLEDDIAFIPDQTINTRCAFVGTTYTCYPVGSGQFYTIDLEGSVQHNFGLFIMVQWRP